MEFHMLTIESVLRHGGIIITFNITSEVSLSSRPEISFDLIGLMRHLTIYNFRCQDLNMGVTWKLLKKFRFSGDIVNFENQVLCIHYWHFVKGIDWLINILDCLIAHL